MSQCCIIPHTGDIPTCPMNGQATKPVGRKTIESLVKPEAATALTPQPYFFCDAPDCDTVYVSALGVTDIQKKITQRVKTGECRCEETNPSGGCCLGSVAKAIRHAVALKEQGLL